MFEKPVKAKALHRDGHVFPIELTVLRLNGQRPGLVFFVRDLTERRRLQSELLQSQQRYKAIVENIEDGYFEVEPGGKYVFLNEAYCKSFGYRIDEMLGQSYRKFYDAESIPRIHLAFVSVWETGVPLKAFEYLITRKDGEKRFVEDSVSLKRDRKGQPVGFLGIRRDITERKLSETAMRASESRWRDLFERASDFIYTCDLEGRFTAVNGVGEQLTGYSREELIGKSTTMLLAPEWLVVDSSIREDLHAGRPLASYELGIVTKSGRSVTLEVCVSLLVTSGMPVGVLGIGRDISARRRTERFERGRGSILEDVARDRPLAEVLMELAALVEKELPGSACPVVFWERDGLEQNAVLRLVAGPSLSPDLKHAIELSLSSSQ
jgi:PAS domain S-box-containing protein